MSFRLGRILGFPVELDWSWFAIFVLVAFAVQAGMAGEMQLFRYPPMAFAIAGVLGSLLFFASLLGHELAHCIIARRLGIPIAGITLFFFGGVARMKNEPDSPTDELKMALAGPAFSLVAAAFFYLMWGSRMFDPLLTQLFLYLAIANLMVALFNMIPAFPTDGGRALRAFLWGMFSNYNSATRIASTLGRGFGWALFILGMLTVLYGNLWNGIWLALIGMFLENAAYSAYEQAQWRKVMAGISVRDLMNLQPDYVLPETTLQQAVQDHFMRNPTESIPVARDHQLQGLANLADIRKTPMEDWPLVSIQAIMKPVPEDCLTQPDEDAWDVLSRTDCNESPVLLVVEGEKLVGALSQENLARQLRLRMQIGGR